MSDFASRVQGIPCTIRVDSYSPGCAASWDDPGEGPEFEYTICDRRGRPAPWLDRKVDDTDRELIEADLMHNYDGSSRQRSRGSARSEHDYSNAEIDAYADRYHGVE